MKVAVRMHSGEKVTSVALDDAEVFFYQAIRSWESLTTMQFQTDRGRVMIPKSSIKYIELVH